MFAAGPLKSVKGSYEYYVPRHVSRDQAEQIALERAMIEAVAREFGTSLNMSTLRDMRSSRDGESDNFYASAASFVKGEWVETEGTPKFGIRLDGDDIVVSCEVRGKARAVNKAQAQLSVKILKNLPTAEAESNMFLNGDKLLLEFSSPVSGYLTVYLEDENKNVFRLLPFYSERKPSTLVDADKKYIFFATKEGDSDQYIMTAKGTEHNILYVVFSPFEYIKPVDKAGEEELSLRELSVSDFRKWYQKAQALDDQLQVIPFPIVISNPIED